MAGQMERVRHARERGQILKALQEEYSGRLTRVGDLAGALSLLGFPMTSESLQFSLQYLTDEGYVHIVRVRDTAAWRPDRNPGADGEAIVFARLLPKGVRLIDGDEGPNVGVSFI
jgi:hypothetical protein